MDGGREVRSGVLRLLASVWSRFPTQYHDSPIFGRFFAAVRPLMRRITTEVCMRHLALQHMGVGCPEANDWRLRTSTGMHAPVVSLPSEILLMGLPLQYSVLRELLRCMSTMLVRGLERLLMWQHRV